MESQLLRPKSWMKKANEKVHQLKQLCFKTQTPSLLRAAVSSVTVSSPSPSSSSSFPDYGQTEVFVKNIGMVELKPITRMEATLPVYHHQGIEILAADTSNPADEQMNISSSEQSNFQKSAMHPATQFPSNDDGDHQYGIEIQATATSNPVEAQMIITSLSASKKKKSFNLSKKIKISASKKKKNSGLRSADVKWLITTGITCVLSALAMCLFLRTYPSSSAPEDGSKFIYAAAPAPGHESYFIYSAVQNSKLQVLPGLLICMICSLCFGSTFIFLCLIGNIYPKRFAGSAWIVPIVGIFAKLGFLSSIFSLFGISSLMMPEGLMWLPFLCYIIIVIAMLALHAVMQFHELAGPSAIARSSKIYICRRA